MDVDNTLSEKKIISIKGSLEYWYNKSLYSVDALIDHNILSFLIDEKSEYFNYRRYEQPSICPLIVILYFKQNKFLCFFMAFSETMVSAIIQ